MVLTIERPVSLGRWNGGPFQTAALMSDAFSIRNLVLLQRAAFRMMMLNARRLPAKSVWIIASGLLLFYSSTLHGTIN
jgi:hypothetical protein